MENLLVRTAGAHPEDQVANEPCKLQDETAMGSPSPRAGRLGKTVASGEP